MRKNDSSQNKMSQGSGRVQRAIMQRLRKDGYCLPKDIEGFGQPSKSRAVGRLCERGYVNVFYGLLALEVPGCQAPRDVKVCFVVPPEVDSAEKLNDLRARHGLQSTRPDKLDRVEQRKC